jgi:four helix bundle protein
MPRSRESARSAYCRTRYREVAQTNCAKSEPGIVRPFERVVAWQKGRDLSRRIYEATGRGLNAEDPALTGAMRRAAVAIMSSIAAGLDADRPAEFRRSLSMARASCGELRSLLYLAADARVLGGAALGDLRCMVDELGRAVGDLRAEASRKANAQANRRTWRPTSARWQRP